jgi:hypothetical protein
MMLLSIAALAAQQTTCPYAPLLPGKTRQVQLDGERFQRLPSKLVRKLVVGSVLTEMRQFLGGDDVPWNVAFYRSGDVDRDVGRMDIGGRYKIIGDTVRITWEFGNSERLAFFGSRDGDRAVGVSHPSGCMTVLRVQSRTIPE